MIFREDTDDDEITDQKELDGVAWSAGSPSVHTDPTNEDTDNDEASDGLEVEMGTNPIVHDSTFSRTVTADVEQDAIVTPSVSVSNITGQQAQTLEIVKTQQPMLTLGIPGYLDYGYDFNMVGTFESAVITFEFDNNLFSQAGFFPAIYYYDEESQLLEEVPNQIISGNTVTAPVNHFSTYLLLNKTEFDKVWEQEIHHVRDMDGGDVTIEVVLMIDSSGSMHAGGQAANDPDFLRLEAAKQFITGLQETDRVAVVSFGDDVFTELEFTTNSTANKNIIHNAIDKVIERTPYDGRDTKMGEGMDVSLSKFSNPTPKNILRYVIILTDGDSTDGLGDYKTQARLKGATIYTVGFGAILNSAEESLLQISKDTGGKYYYCEEAVQIMPELNKVKQNITDDKEIDYVTDSNLDGISDYYTKLMCDGKLLDRTRKKVFAKYDAHDRLMREYTYEEIQEFYFDFDQDTLLNGDEITIVYPSETRPYVEIHSSPVKEDTDEDGTSDYADYTPTIPAKYKEQFQHGSYSGKPVSNFMDRVIKLGEESYEIYKKNASRSKEEAGIYALLDWSAEITERNLWVFITSAPVALTHPETFKTLSHYLDGSGDDLYIDVDHFLDISNNATKLYNQTLTWLKTYAENVVADRKTLNIMTRNDKLYAYDNERSEDTFPYRIAFSMGTVRAAVNAKVSRNGNWYTMEFNYDIYDYLDFENRPDAAFPGFSDADLALLHKVGRAKFYEIHGRKTATITWYKGEY